MGNIAREIVEKHLDLCLDAGINHEGINAEVAKGQWEFQIFGKGSKRAADEMWVARYLLNRLCEKYGVDVNYHCKPLGNTDWNGSGMHSNFSTKYLREVGGKEYFDALMEAFDKYKAEHILVYGPDNHLRLTGLHETQSIDKFTYGVSDRGASIRVPNSMPKKGWKGYLEDRRPNSQGDPYKIASRILETIATVPLPKSAARLMERSSESLPAGISGRSLLLSEEERAAVLRVARRAVILLVANTALLWGELHTMNIPDPSSRVSRRAEAAALWMAALFPAWPRGSTSSSLSQDPSAAVQAASAAEKIVQFAFPLVWVVLVQRQKLRLARPKTAGVAEGLALGAAVLAGMLLLYFLWLKPAGYLAAAAGPITAKATALGMGSPAAIHPRGRIAVYRSTRCWKSITGGGSSSAACGDSCRSRRP